MMRITERLSREGVTQAYCRTDVSRSNFIDILTMVGMHTQKATDTLRLALGAILNRRALRQRARIDTQVSKATDKGIRDDLEGQCTKCSRVAHLKHNRGPCIRIDTSGSWNVQRRWEEGNDGVEHSLYTLVFQGRSAEHRNQFPLNCSFAERVY